MTDLERLVKEFAESVAAQTLCIERGDANSGNAYAERYIVAFEKIREHRDLGRDALAVLLDDRRADVRVTAAAFLLRYVEERAKAVLSREAKQPGMVGINAGQALQRWRDGTWALDPE